MYIIDGVVRRMVLRLGEMCIKIRDMCGKEGMKDVLYRKGKGVARKIKEILYAGRFVRVG